MNVTINDPTKISVPDDNFPFITCYGRIINRIHCLEDCVQMNSEYEDALDRTKIWNFGDVCFKHGYSFHLLELDIWNNEISVSAGETFHIFKNAENCKISIESENNILNDCIQIRNITTNANEFEKLDNYFYLQGNYSNKHGIIDGHGDHCKTQIGININNEMPVKDISFILYFEYDSENMHIKIPFNCKINFTDNISICTEKEIKNDYTIFSGNIQNNNGAIRILAYNNNLLKDICTTSSGGYGLFLIKGQYNFIIKDNLSQRDFRNILINNGIEENYKFIENGLIYDINNDVYKFIYKDNFKYMVSCKITNQNNNPTKNLELIISNENTFIYCKTKQDGLIDFCLEPGIYDIRIRSEYSNVNIIYAFQFNDGDSFFYKLMQLYPYYFNNMSIKIK